MISSFFESIKYVGYMYPLALFRIYLGYFFFKQALERVQGNFLISPKLAENLREWLPQSLGPEWYLSLIESWLIPNWKVAAYFITYCEFLIGVSFIIGFFVRPVALLGLFLAIHFILVAGGMMTLLYQIHFMLFLLILWQGAGRCLGMDYFFYKRQRGIWW